MANRVELKDAELESVVGGRFIYNTYKNADGSTYMKCKVTDCGTYFCSDNAKRQVSLYFMEHPEASAQDGIDYALEIGVFWN